MSIDKRQFIICKDKIDREDFLSLTLDQGYILNYHKSLKVTKTEDYILIGLAFSIHPDYPVGEDLSCSLEKQVQMWGGRFIVYQNGRIYTDAVKSLGIFYLRKKGVRAISGSIHLLADIYQLERKNEFELSFKPGGMTSDYYPGPCTPFKGIKRLMQYERLDLFSEQLVLEDDTKWNLKYKGLPAEELTKQLIQYEVHMMREIEKEYDHVYVPLTGGIDSRCVGALCNKAGITYTVYTEQRSKETHMVGLSKGDTELPQLIADAWKVNWEFRECSEWNQGRFDEIVAHSMGMIRNANLFTYAYGQYPEGVENSIILHGAVWQIAKVGYENSVSGECTTMCGQKKNLCNWLGDMLSSSSVHRESVRVWEEDIQTKGQKDLRWSDRFMYEQRVGCWFSDLNQALDVVEIDCIAPVNNYEVLSILMAYPEKMRKKGKHQRMIIHTCTPETDHIPINPKPLGKRIKKNIRNQIRSCKRTICEVMVRSL